ncbi:MAG: hypothetical protein LBI92_05865 [Azoarcus sp.]|jgi:hypothetical protein|nr:hypothetical protein [Azoarcus sp.]
MKTFFLHLFVTAAVAVVALVLYDRLVVRPALVVGVVDIAAVYREKEAEFTRLVTGATTDDGRRIALEMAQEFSRRLPAALAELPDECNCLVVLKTAIAGAPASVDLTPALRRKVGMP